MSAVQQPRGPPLQTKRRDYPAATLSNHNDHAPRSKNHTMKVANKAKKSTTKAESGKSPLANKAKGLPIPRGPHNGVYSKMLLPDFPAEVLLAHRAYLIAQDTCVSFVQEAKSRQVPQKEIDRQHKVLHDKEFAARNARNAILKRYNLNVDKSDLQLERLDFHMRQVFDLTRRI